MNLRHDKPVYRRFFASGPCQYYVKMRYRNDNIIINFNIIHILASQSHAPLEGCKDKLNRRTGFAINERNDLLKKSQNCSGVQINMMIFSFFMGKFHCIVSFEKKLNASGSDPLINGSGTPSNGSSTKSHGFWKRFVVIPGFGI